MSVYGGFTTRLQESQYGGLVCKLISLLERRIVAAVKGGKNDLDVFDNEQWPLAFSSVYKAMKKLESQKYQPPKFSVYCKDLAQFYGTYVSNTQSRSLTRDESTNSSRMSSNGREWDLCMRQSALYRVEAMLIEESKIPKGPLHSPDFQQRGEDGGILKPVLRPIQRQKESQSPPPIKVGRNRQLSIKTPRTQDTYDSLTYPRSVANSRIDPDSSGSSSSNARQKRKGRKMRLAEVYQDRGYVKLLAELRS